MSFVLTEFFFSEIRTKLRTSEFTSVGDRQATAPNSIKTRWMANIAEATPSGR